MSDIPRLVGISTATLRRYERLGLLPFTPKRDVVGRRVFSDEEIEVIRRIVAGKHPGGRTKLRGP